MANCYCTTSSVDLCDHCTETFSQGWDSGKGQERERIIALIEEQYPGYENYGWEHITPDDIGVIVALIKGESE